MMGWSCFMICGQMTCWLPCVAATNVYCSGVSLISVTDGEPPSLVFHLKVTSGSFDFHASAASMVAQVLLNSLSTCGESARAYYTLAASAPCTRSREICNFTASALEIYVCIAMDIHPFWSRRL